MSSPEQDELVRMVRDWFSQVDYRHDGVLVKDNKISIYIGGHKIEMPEKVAEAFKLLN